VKAATRHVLTVVISAATLYASSYVVVTQGGVAGTWRVEVPGQAAPWEAVFRVDESNLIGAVSVGATTFGTEIYNGSTDGRMLTFKFDIGPRTVTMTGTVGNDTIDFVWDSAPRPGFNRPDPTDPMFGDAAPRNVTATRAPDATDRVAEAAAHARQPPHVTFDRLLHADAEPHNWLTFSGALAGWRYSLLTQLTSANVKNLELAWLWQHDDSPSPFESTPLVVDGVLYTVKTNDVVALDGKTGRVLWTFHYTPSGFHALYRTNRGLAILGSTLFMGTLDAHLVAIDAFSGRLRWDVAVANSTDPTCQERDCYFITHAPLVVKDKIVVGTSGGDGKVRGFIAAFDAASGKEVWRFHTVPGPGEPGHETWFDDAWKTGGAAVWNTGAYDAELNLTYWGTGNPGPADQHGTDLLYSDCVVALDADTGTLRWYYQFTPHDAVDWDATQIPVLTDLQWRGRQRKVMLFANRNGLFYVLDRASGEFLAGTPFVEVNWMTGFDHDGRPLRTARAPLDIDHEFSPTGTLKPGPGEVGATNWYPPSYNPRTGLLYVPFSNIVPSPRYGAIRALDPITGDRKWEFRRESAIFQSGTLATASGLVFAGLLGQYATGRAIDGQFYALDGATGQLLWQFSLPGSIKSGVMTYAVDGKQYVAVAAGNTLFAFSMRE